MDLGTFKNPIATICHNEDDYKDSNYRRVHLWVENYRILAQSEDENEPHSPELPNVKTRENALLTIKSAYQNTVWDLRFNMEHLF
jgi:hypothetical protein